MQVKEDRIVAVDALRGFAMAGIVIAHMIEQFIAAPRPDHAWVAPDLMGRITYTVAVLFIGGKFFSIFSLLFGMSFSIMMENAARRGRSFSGRFLWRLVILFAIGVVHMLFYRGDILTVYALVGVTLILFYGIPDKWLLVVAAILFLGTGRYLSFILSGPSDFFFRELLPGQSTTLAYVETLRDGSLSEVFRLNLTEGSFSRLSLQFGLLGRGYLTLAYFLVGLWLMRSGVMRALLDYKNAIRNTLLWSLLMAALFYFLFRLSMYYLPQPWNYSSWPVVEVFTFYDLTNIATTAIFVCGFLLLFLHKPGWQWVKLASYGRLALSNYLLQTLVGTFIFYGWGLGLLGQLHDWQTFLLGVLIVLLQVRLSIWWLSRFRYGPAEWLWRCMTYFKVLPFRGSRQVPGAT